jgi:anti-sigma regulatory factor (Ser/Thr protein kinase)
MITMAPPRPTHPASPPRPASQASQASQAGLHGCQVRLPAEPATVAEARDHVRAVLAAWDVPVDADIAVLLASDLVTNAILHQADGTITLAVTTAPGQLRIDVCGTAVHLPPQGPLPSAVQTGAGLTLIMTLADQWGWYYTPVGRAVYFTLAFPHRT